MENASRVNLTMHSVRKESCVVIKGGNCINLSMMLGSLTVQYNLQTKT